MTARKAVTEMEMEVATMADEQADAIAGMTFDAALAELERTVAELEAGGQPLERDDRPVRARRRAPASAAQELLADAELRVRRLVEGARGALAEAELRDDEPG